MKKLLFVLLFLLSAASLEAAPFLVCDPYTTPVQPVYFLLVIDGGAAIRSNSVLDPVSGNAMLKYDLTAIATGSHTVVVQAVDSWGQIGVASSPFSFTRPAGTLAAPTNVKISLP
jgi:predicted RNA methylase